MNEGMYSSKTDEWATPIAFFNEINNKFHFELDVCATPENAKCPKYFTKQDDGLLQEWGGAYLLDESPIRSKDWRVGQKGLRKRTTRRDSSMPLTRKNRYKMVA